MRTEVVIEADTIDMAVGRILQELKEDDDDAVVTGSSTTTSSGRHNVIYFDGWDGLGASAVLREVGRRLATGPEFSDIIHIDCSKWESRRAAQRALAEHLQLPTPVMETFDAQDEEDDYNGIHKGSRFEIPKVAREIYNHVQKQLSHRFLVIFNNGNQEEINLENFGFPLSGYSRNKLLWSFQGGFRLYPRTEVNKVLVSMTAMTDIVLSAASGNLNEDKFSDILRHEAEELVTGGKINIGGIDWPAAAANCFLYTMRLCGMGGHYDLGTHGCNYWRCDGVIQLKQGEVDTDDGADTLWLSCEALNRKMKLDANYHQRLQSPSPVTRRLHEGIACWTSPTYGSMLIPPDQSGHIPRDMFKPFNKLCVLKLSACVFSFKSAPPFLCCHNLRFLWLDHCQDESGADDGVGDKEGIRRCLRRLWVLDVRYSNYTLLSADMVDFMTQLRELYVIGQSTQDMDVFQGRLSQIRKLRVTKSRATCSRLDRKCMFQGKDKMELLDFSGNVGYVSVLSVESSCSSLKTVIIDGSNLRGISLKGCSKLKNLLLSGSFEFLDSLDLSGTAVKTLDLSEVTAPKLDMLFLLDCENLCAILWPSPGEDRRKRYLDKIQIDTTQKEGAASGDTGGRSPAEFGWYVCVRDERLLGSLEPVKDYFGDNDAHVEISTTAALSRSPHADPLKEDDAIYTAAAAAAAAATLNKDTIMQHDDGGDSSDDSAIMCICPPTPPMTSQGCYMHIQDSKMTRTTLLQTACHITVPGFICDGAKILHVHDSLFVTRVLAAPLDATWDQLEWCRVERCPKLKHVFEGRVANKDAFSKLKTMWASHFPKAHYIFKSVNGAFGNLKLLHLYCCPRLLIAVLSEKYTELQSLETLEIMWCADLRAIFSPKVPYTHIQRILAALQTGPEAHAVQFLKKNLYLPKLKRLHLHELPMLQDYHEFRWYSYCIVITPMLETVKIRGCWSLRTLPYIDSKNVVECNCEKEWWDKLEWDSVEHRSHYKPIHSQYYKKSMLRGSPLR